MAKKQSKFNIRRFATLFIPFALVAALLLYTKPNDQNADESRPFPLYNLKLNGTHSSGSIILNGISIGHHNSHDSDRTSTISLTPWLNNGANTLEITSTPKDRSAKPQLTAKLETEPMTGEVKQQTLFENSVEPSTRTIIVAENLPSWIWQKGQTAFHDLNEVKQRVTELHKAFQQRNLQLIKSIEAPMFEDMERLTGREGLERRQYRSEIILKGEVEPLSKLTLIPYDEGRIIRVTTTNGEAPIQVYMRYGNGGKIILTGKYWSKINGIWHVVR